MDSLRVMLVAPPWISVPPPAYGGTEMMIADIATALQRAGHDVIVATVADSTCPVGIRAVYDRGQGIGAGAPTEIRHLEHAFDAAVHEADVVHDHTVLGPLYAVARSVPVPMVTTNHGPFTPEAQALYGTVADRVPVLAISHAQADLAGPVPVHSVVHHGIDLTRYRFEPEPGDHLLFLGRMHPTKGVHVAARAARATGTPLVIAAKMREVSEQIYFEQCVRPLLGRGVEFVGEVGPVEKVDLLSGARALVNPIDWPEPFGLVMIEALACGTPVLTLPSGAAPEIVEHGVSGYLCADEDDLVRRIDDVERLDRSTCRLRAERHFSADRMAADHVEVYRSVLADGAGRTDGSIRGTPVSVGRD